jgi:hypothetical protein
MLSCAALGFAGVRRIVRKSPMNMRLLCLAAWASCALWFSPLRAEDDSGKSSDKKKEAVQEGLKFDAAARQRIGLVTAAALETNLSPVTVAYGVVLDPSPLALLDAELDGAAAALAIARGQEMREQALFAQNQIATRPALEAAQLLVRAGETRFETALRRLATEWGDLFVRLDATNRHALIATLLRREVVLLRVEVPLGETFVTNSSPVRLNLPDDRHTATAEIFCEAPTVDARTQGRAVLLRAPGPDPALRPGAAVTAQFTRPEAAAHGRLLPPSAIVRHLGHAWAYLATKDDAFEHREITLDRLLDDGWFTTTELPAGAKVVTAGAQLLLSEELKARFAGE